MKLRDGQVWMTRGGKIITLEKNYLGHLVGSEGNWLYKDGGDAPRDFTVFGIPDMPCEYDLWELVK